MSLLEVEVKDVGPGTEVVLGVNAWFFSSGLIRYLD
jgi:hypothetical protein